MKDLTFAQLKLISSSVKDDLDLFAIPASPDDLTSWQLRFSAPGLQGVLLHSHGKKIRQFKTLDSLVKFVHDNFNPEVFKISFSNS